MFRPLFRRDPNEAHRASTPLELFYDLATVVAISAAAAGLHHAIGAGDTVEGLARYVSIFFAIWWSWMNFTWFASAHDSSDTSYTLCVFALIFGTCVLAAGVQHFFATGDNLAGVAGWTIQRAALVFLWLRVAAGAQDGARTARRYALGLTVLQSGWVLTLLLLPDPLRWAVGAGLLVLELALPSIAGAISWHRGHIIERYGLLALIVLGEGIAAIHLILLANYGGGLFAVTDLSEAIAATVIVCSMWWLYFRRNEEAEIGRDRGIIAWGYGHGVVFASAAAVGAGMDVWSDLRAAQETAGPALATLAVAVPLAIYLISLTLIFDGLRLDLGREGACLLCAIGLILGAYLLPNLWVLAVQLVALILWLRAERDID